tara:strand:- start:2233 stop:2397 length:165 start_codon:yes stop_codon:yes gene_type:complete
MVGFPYSAFNDWSWAEGVLNKYEVTVIIPSIMRPETTKMRPRNFIMEERLFPGK